MNPLNHVFKLTVLFCLALPVFVHAQTTAKDYFQSGTAKADKGDWAGAIADFDRAISLEPSCAEGRIGRFRDGTMGMEIILENGEKVRCAL